MWPYWILFTAVALVAILRPHRLTKPLSRNMMNWGVEWIALFLFVSLFIGFRHEVGGDWFNYFRHLDAVSRLSFAEVLPLSDPGYKLLNWVSVQMGWGIYGVNLACGIVFSVGLTRFCRSMPRPWLSLTVAVPYLVIVVAMGYSRQGVALGFAMMGLVALVNQSTARFALWIILAATFHKTAVILLPIAALANTRNRWTTIFWLTLVTIGAYWLFLQDSVETLVENYIEAEYQSQGALIRLLMNALPATLLLIYFNRFHIPPKEAGLWRWLSIISLGLLAILFVSPSSTAIDRIALYMLPLQMVVFSYLPEVLGNQRRSNQKWVAAVACYYACVNFVWLNFAANSRYWLPYKFLPFEL